MGIVAVIRRLHDEFTAMPGLTLTEAQARRLCSADADACASALVALTAAGFLNQRPDGRYARVLAHRAAPLRSPVRVLR